MKKFFAILLSIMLCIMPMLTGCGQSKEKLKIGNVIILGDSYSTFDGYMLGGYLSWYSNDINEAHTDVFDVKDTWWWQVIDQTESTLIANSSYSGSLICNAKDSITSFIGRFEVLKTSEYIKENQIDTIFVYGGLNDVWNNVNSGNLMYSDWTSDNLKEIVPGFCYLLNSIREALPDTRIIVLLDETISANIQLSFDYACYEYGAEMIVPTKISKKNAHPNKEGMKSISTQILEYLEKTENKDK